MRTEKAQLKADLPHLLHRLWPPMHVPICNTHCTKPHNLSKDLPPRGSVCVRAHTHTRTVRVRVCMTKGRGMMKGGETVRNTRKEETQTSADPALVAGKGRAHQRALPRVPGTNGAVHVCRGIKPPRIRSNTVGRVTSN
jgi:hypothetical protein